MADESKQKPCRVLKNVTELDLEDKLCELMEQGYHVAKISERRYGYYTVILIHPMVLAGKQTVELQALLQKLQSGAQR